MPGVSPLVQYVIEVESTWFLKKKERRNLRATVGIEAFLFLAHCVTVGEAFLVPGALLGLPF